MIVNKKPRSCFECDFHNYHYCDITGNNIEDNFDNGTIEEGCLLKSVDDVIAEIEKVPFFVHLSGGDCYYRSPSEIKDDIYRIIREFSVF